MVHIFSPFKICEIGSFTSDGIFDLMKRINGTVYKYIVKVQFNTILFCDIHCSRYSTCINSFSPHNIFLQIKLKHRQGYKASKSKRRHESVSLASKPTLNCNII